MNPVPLTWDRVKEVIIRASPNGITNRQIVRQLGWDDEKDYPYKALGDVAHLTRLMFLAGEVKRKTPEEAGVWFYYVN